MASGLPPEEIDAVGQDNIPLEGRSLFLFPPESRLRAAAYDIVETQWFKFTIFAIIILSCVELTTEGPRVEEGSVEAKVQYYRQVRYLRYGRCGVWGLMPSRQLSHSGNDAELTSLHLSPIELQ